jgi:hypothetical protein
MPRPPPLVDEAVAAVVVRKPGAMLLASATNSLRQRKPRPEAVAAAVQGHVVGEAGGQVLHNVPLLLAAGVEAAAHQAMSASVASNRGTGPAIARSRSRDARWMETNLTMEEIATSKWTLIDYTYTRYQAADRRSLGRLECGRRRRLCLLPLTPSSELRPQLAFARPPAVAVRGPCRPARRSTTAAPRRKGLLE